MPALAVPSFTSSQPIPATSVKSSARVIQEVDEQWTFTEEEVENSPSVQDGLPLADERERRSKGVNFIQQVGMMLRLPQLTISTAAVFFHRFLMRHSLKSTKERKALHHYEIAATALFIATKTEENIRRMKEIIVACCRVAQKNPNLVVDEQSKDWWRWRDTLLFNEDVLLEGLCFDLTVESTHMILFELMKTLKQSMNKDLRNAAWAFINDSALTVLCLLFTPRVIAVAAFYFGAKRTSLDPRFPDADDADGRPWWTQNGVKFSNITKAIIYMADYFEANAAKLSGGKNAYEGMKESMQEENDSDIPNHESTPQPQVINEVVEAPATDDDSRGTKRDRNGASKQDGDVDIVAKPAGTTEEESERSQKKRKSSAGNSSSANGVSHVKVEAKSATARSTDPADEAGSEEGEVEE